MTISYPNSDHRDTDKQARNGALAEARQLASHSARLARRLGEDPGYVACARDGGDLEGMVSRLREHLAVLETLGKVRSWHDARQRYPHAFHDDEQETR